MSDSRGSKTLSFARGRRPILSPLVPQQQKKKGLSRRVLGLQLPGSSSGARARDSASSARLRSTSTANMAMLCIPSANLELLAALQQEMHGSLTGELDLDSWGSVSEAVQKSATTNTVIIAGVGTRWSRPCHVLFKTLEHAVETYRELAVGVPVELMLVDHETSIGMDIERVPLGVPATFVFVRGVPIVFKRPATSSTDSGAAAASTQSGSTAGKQPSADGGEDDDENPPEDQDPDDVEEDESEEEDEEGEGAEKSASAAAASQSQKKTRKCMVGPLSMAQAEFLVEHCVSAATRIIKTMPRSAQNITSPVVDLYEDLDSPFTQELRIRRR